jgi:hypothetical protein
VAIVSVGVLVSFIPIIFAWRNAEATPGSTTDADFWLILQNAMLQILGVCTAMLPIYKRFQGAAWHWARAFSIICCFCAISSIPIYLYMPTMWSALLSFFGSAAQAYLALQLAMATDTLTAQSIHKERKID